MEVIRIDREEETKCGCIDNALTDLKYVVHMQHPETYGFTKAFPCPQGYPRGVYRTPKGGLCAHFIDILRI